MPKKAPKSGKDKAAKQEKETRKLLKRQFKKFDKDGSGSLEKDELKTFIMKISVSAKPALRRAFFKLYDANPNKLTFKQFEEVMKKCGAKTQQKQDEILTIFKKFDADNSGELEGSEIKKAMKALGDVSSSKGRKELLAKYDKSHDGKLSFKEFRRLVVDMENAAKDDKLVHRVFVKFDKDKSGKIEPGEMKAFLSSLSLATSGSQRLALRKAVAKNPDKGMTEAEFKVAFKACREEAAKRQAKMRQVFKKADRDGSGELSRKELSPVVKHFGIDIEKDDLKKKLKQVDADGDGALDFAEFQELMFILQDTY